MQWLVKDPSEKSIAEILALRDVLRHALDQVEMMLGCPPGMPRADSSLALRDLGNIADNLTQQVQKHEREIDLQIGKRSVEMAEMSITESRSTIALTILAFAFVPVSLAASIFGMNVREINSSCHSIWTFVVTALTMVLVAALSWLSYRAFHNNLLLRRFALSVRAGQAKSLDRHAGLPGLPQPANVRRTMKRKLEAAVPSPRQAWTYRLGLRPIEKTAIANRDFPAQA